MQYYTHPEQIGQKLAAVMITSFFKMIFSKKFYKNMSLLLRKVKIIQRHWRMCLLIKKSRQNVLANINDKIKRHEALQKEMSKQWNLIKTSNRYEIHVCSYSLEEFKRLTIRSLRQKENNQITRIFRALETDVNIIYVLPFQMGEEVIKYYHSVFGFNNSSIEQKIFFIVSENRARIEEHCPITAVSALLYSPKALKRIRQIVGKQYAYIVPSFPSVEYINLSAELNLPILGPNQNVAKLYSTKSGALKILSNIAKKEKSPFEVPKSVVSIFS
jgi:IQ domain-containing protein H